MDFIFHKYIKKEKLQKEMIESPWDIYRKLEITFFVEEFWPSLENKRIEERMRSQNSQENDSSETDSNSDEEDEIQKK